MKLWRLALAKIKEDYHNDIGVITMGSEECDLNIKQS